MKATAQRRYTWSNIADKYKLLIEESLNINTKADVLSTTVRLPYQELLGKELAHLKTINTF